MHWKLLTANTKMRIIGGLDSFIHGDKIKGIAHRHKFILVKEFHIDDTSILEYVKKYLDQVYQVIVAADTKNNLTSVFIEDRSKHMKSR